MPEAAPIPLYSCRVQPDWLDYNDHFNDACYGIVFSRAVDCFFEVVGMDADTRARTGLTIYTLESHIRYLLEAGLDAPLEVSGLLYDHDAKRMHVLLLMDRGDTGVRLATAEQMLMCIDTAGPRAAPFPPEVTARMHAIAQIHRGHPELEAAGRPMGIRR